MQTDLGRPGRLGRIFSTLSGEQTLFSTRTVAAERNFVRICSGRKNGFAQDPKWKRSVPCVLGVPN